jgi:hypothetical protein
MAAAVEEREEGENWLSTKRTVKGVPCPDLYASLFNYDGLVDRSFGMKFHMPGMHAGWDEFRKHSDDQKEGEMLGRLNVYHVVTPGKLNTLNYFFGFGRNFAKSEEVTQNLLIGFDQVLKEDAFATEEIEGLLSQLKELPPEFLAKGDAHAVRGRRKLEALIKKEM